MTTIDELLKAHPAPFRAIPLYGHYGQPQFQVCDKDGYSIAHAWGQDAQDICDAMNELVRLREVHAKQTPLFWEANAEVMRLRDSSMVQTHLRMAEKLEKAEAERDALKTRNAELEACSVEWGAWDDILGKPEPDLDNVREEARRVFGEGVTVAEYAGFVSVEYVASDRLDPVSAPTIASAYACLRALPSKVTK